MTMRSRFTRLIGAALLAVALPTFSGAQGTAAPAVSAARQRADSIAKSFDKTEVMIPMRDGVKLHTTVFVPRGHAAALPFIFVRTPYGIAAGP
jgi:uncharacterized protein